MASPIAPGLDDVGLASLSPKASQACAACRKQKRRCDKALPSCALCTRMGRICDYSDITPAPSSDDFQMLRQKVQDLEHKLLLSSPQTTSSSGMTPLSANSVNGGDITNQILGGGTNGVTPANEQDKGPFPTLFFLDAVAFEETRQSIPRPVLRIPPEVFGQLGTSADIQQIVGTYFQSIHPWLPMVSKKRLFALMANPNNEIGADYALLFLCMKLILERPQDTVSPTDRSLYWTAKTYFTLLEANALLSVQLLQASVLIATYEVGHGIYPAAFITTGHIARLGQAMGLHSRKDAPQMGTRFPTWTEQEEVRRAWWAVQLLDRYYSWDLFLLALVNMIQDTSTLVVMDIPLRLKPLPETTYYLPTTRHGTRERL